MLVISALSALLLGSFLLCILVTQRLCVVYTENASIKIKTFNVLNCIGFGKWSKSILAKKSPDHEILAVFVGKPLEHPTFLPIDE